jgi:ribulose-5-phosphate 4-epimerase/fuculose-1-phosphate aldolase
MKILLAGAAVLMLSAIAFLGNTHAAAQVKGAAAKTALPAADPASMDQIAELVLANRILNHYGVLDAYGHVSVRSSRNPNHFFLARHIPAGTVTAKDIIEYDLNTEPVIKTDYIGYSERFIHGDIYKARPDVKAVVHGHAPDVVTLTIAQIPLRPVSHMGAFLGLDVPVFDTRSMTKDGEMLIRNHELGQALAMTLGRNPAALIRGHGAVVVADSLHVVAGRAYYRRARLLHDDQRARGAAGDATAGRKADFPAAIRDRKNGHTGRLRAFLGVGKTDARRRQTLTSA